MDAMFNLTSWCHWILHTAPLKWPHDFQEMQASEVHKKIKTTVEVTFINEACVVLCILCKKMDEEVIHKGRRDWYKLSAGRGGW